MKGIGNMNGRDCINLLWNNCSLYGETRNISQCSMKNMKGQCTVKKVDDIMVKLISKGNEESENYYSDGTTPVRMRLIETNNAIYLSDSGLTCNYVKKNYGMTRKKVIEILGRLRTESAEMIDNDICIEVADSNKLSAAKRSLMKIIRIIEIFGGTKNETQS